MVIILFWVYGSLVIYKIFKHIVNLISHIKRYCKKLYGKFVKKITKIRLLTYLV